MQNKKLIIGMIVIVAFVGLVLITKSILLKNKSSKAPAAAQANKGTAKEPAKKMIPKDKGALIVKIYNSKKTEVPLRLKAFRAIDGKSSVYAASFIAGRSEELVPGTYDIEIDSTPQKLYKGIKVSQGKETVEDLGCLTGSVQVRTLNSKKAPAYYPIRVLYPKTSEMVIAYMTNKPLEITPGVYDIEIGTSPRLYQRNVKIGAGKEVLIDLGCVTGTLIVKTVDESKKDVRTSLRILRADNNELISSSLSNRPIEISQGKYNIELFSTPKQYKKDVYIKAGEDTTVEFTVKPPKTAPAAAKAPARSKAKK